MKNEPITLRHWPKAILHVDANSFFASVEQVINPELKGKPIVTGAERGIVTAASIEARALGINRGMRLSEVTARCPQCILIASNFENYGLYSQGIFNILRRYTPDVEEYSIDEAFADITGVRRLHHASYDDIARHIQQAIHSELSIPVSVGVSLSKSLAKLCSKFRKPRGFTCVPGHLIHELLVRTPVEKIWGVGPNTTALLHKQGIRTALEFAKRPLYFIESLLGKVGVELWQELRGDAMSVVDATPKHTYASIQKTRTFTPPSSDRHYVFAQLIQNLEGAVAKARRFGLATDRISVYTKQQDFRVSGIELRLSHPTSSQLDIAGMLRSEFDRLFRAGRFYRATGITLHNLSPVTGTQFTLFEDPTRLLKTESAAQAVDAITQQFGRRSIFLAERLRLSGAATASSPLPLPVLEKIAV
jgi:DNA polymerase-4/DNA polymerase V